MAKILKSKVGDIETLKSGNIEEYLKKFTPSGEQLEKDQLVNLIDSSKLSSITIYSSDSKSSIKSYLDHALKGIKSGEKKEVNKELVRFAIVGFLKDDPIATEWLSIPEHRHAIISELLGILEKRPDTNALTNGGEGKSSNEIVFKSSEKDMDTMVYYARDELIYFFRSFLNFMGSFFRITASLLRPSRAITVISG